MELCLAKKQIVRSSESILLFILFDVSKLMVKITGVARQRWGFGQSSYHSDAPSENRLAILDFYSIIVWDV